MHRIGLTIKPTVRRFGFPCCSVNDKHSHTSSVFHKRASPGRYLVASIVGWSINSRTHNQQHAHAAHHANGNIPHPVFIHQVPLLTVTLRPEQGFSRIPVRLEYYSSFFYLMPIEPIFASLSLPMATFADPTLFDWLTIVPCTFAFSMPTDPMFAVLP